MITIDRINLNVRDQDTAKRFWIESMGFEEVGDDPMDGPDSARWITVRPPDSDVEVVLYSPSFDESKVGYLSNVLFTCDDIQAAHRELSARGVEFPDEPSKQDWGWWATFKDNEGNLYGLGQR